MIILNANLKISVFFSLISGYILKYGSTPKKFLFLIIIISGALSAIFLNDTIVLILTPLIILMDTPFYKWLLLAMSSTLAGNLTLLSSVANLIVAERAKNEGFEIKFMEFLKVGFLVTMLTLGFGIIYFKLLGG